MDQVAGTGRGTRGVNDWDSSEDEIAKWAERAFVVLVLVGLAVLLSGHGIVTPSAPRVSPTGVTTTMDGPAPMCGSAVSEQNR